MPEIRGHEFDVGENYADLEFVGEGAYGIVVRANDRANGNRVGKYYIYMFKINPFQLPSKRFHRLTTIHTASERFVKSKSCCISTMKTLFPSTMSSDLLFSMK